MTYPQLYRNRETCLDDEGTATILLVLETMAVFGVSRYRRNPPLPMAWKCTMTLMNEDLLLCALYFSKEVSSSYTKYPTGAAEKN
jgi:hypothetical protein